MSHSVPPEVAHKIVRLLGNASAILATLARTSRTFQAQAERYLYNDVTITPCNEKIPLLQALARSPRVAQLVRYFRYTHSYRGGRGANSMIEQLLLEQRMVTATAQPSFWAILRAAIANLGLLEYFEITDDPIDAREPRANHSGILAPPPPSLRASEIFFSLQWDANVAAFLATQTTLRKLRLPDVIADEPIDTSSQTQGAMSHHLTVFEGPLFAVQQLDHCPLTRLKFIVETEVSVMLLRFVLPGLHRFKDLYSLSIIILPAELAANALEVIASSCPNLRYLSVIPWYQGHFAQRGDIANLCKLRYLRILELEAEDWLPPLVSGFQRAIAIELRMYIPTLEIVGFYLHDEHVHWVWKPDGTMPIEALIPDVNVARPTPPKMKGKGSGIGQRMEIETDIEMDLGPGIGSQNSLGLETDGHGEGGRANARVEERLVSYAGPDAWHCYPRRMGNAPWYKVAAMDEIWRHANTIMGSGRR